MAAMPARTSSTSTQPSTSTPGMWVNACLRRAMSADAVVSQRSASYQAGATGSRRVKALSRVDLPAPGGATTRPSR